MLPFPFYVCAIINCSSCAGPIHCVNVVHAIVQKSPRPWLWLNTTCDIMVHLHGICVRGLSDSKQETTLVHCTQVHAAGWCGRPDAHAGRFAASVNHYAESVINV